MTVHQVKRALILVVWIPVLYQMCVDSMHIVCLSTMLEFVPVSLVIQETPILVVLLCSIVVQTANVQLVPDVTMEFAHVSISTIWNCFQILGLKENILIEMKDLVILHAETI
jgi:hypothetical protein